MTTKETLPFRWTYIILPLTVLLLSIILTAYFYHLLPAEVAYHFEPDGSPDKWLNRGMIIIWAITPQVFLVLLAGVITWGISRVNTPYQQIESNWLKSGRMLLLIGNMIALPQIILCFAMFDIFRYNSYQTHIMPLWVFVLIIVALGSIILGTFFIKVVHELRNSPGNAAH